ncbi:RNA polymerase sigma factor [Mucilaginibacter celer]|uniref:Sigma-70 family RNA polymerase sigma factor n=1 Tax=Mucilaginibacter celer TaxID=2305508 RepID=A0A494VP85_9SPHI|nr:sigma-70 family RNA polymerase sigma factor [Mucilaginibacter celer]AYL96534.1 sigma-70 family RNA polymerase sigma factor [Mucilaginibacter celer]
MSNTLSQTKSLKSISERDIVLGLKSIENDALITQYQNEFYRRYAPYVFKLSVQRCQIFADADDFAKEIMQLTFIKALKTINNFTIALGIDDVILKKMIKAWLGRIANNNFNKLYAEYKNEEVELETVATIEPTYDLFEELFNPVPEEQPSAVLILLREAMEQLKEIDKHIIISYAAENCLYTTQHIRDSTMKILCETYNTTPDNIRQRKNRALKKIKLFCFKN